MPPRLTLGLLAIALGCGTPADGAPTPGAVAPVAAVAPAPTTGASVARVGRARPDARAVATVAVASRVGDRGAADRSGKHARLGEAVTLYAVVVTDDGTVYSDAPSLRWERRTVTPRPLADAPELELAWAKVEPTETNLSNTSTGSFRYERIPYATTAMTATGGAIAADVHPTRTPDRGDGVGTMRYQLTATQGDRTIASAGIEARRGRGAGGLSEDVHRITIRRDDTFLGYLTEMYGQPYIWASAGGTARTHQSERLEGSDCADLMVYGARRAGLDIPYTYTGSLPTYARTLARGDLANDGIYRDARGTPVPFTRAGDLILFPRHVGALFADRGSLGVVDVDDLMIHTLFDSPKEQAIRDSGYAENPIQILRWKGLR